MKFKFKNPQNQNSTVFSKMSLEINPGETAFQAYRRLYIAPLVTEAFKNEVKDPVKAAMYVNDKNKPTPVGRDYVNKLYREVYETKKAEFEEWRKKQAAIIREKNPEFSKKILTETQLPDARKMVVYASGTSTRAAVTGADGKVEEYRLTPVKKREGKKSPDGSPKKSDWVTFLGSDEAKAICAKVKADNPGKKGAELAHIRMSALSAAYAKTKPPKEAPTTPVAK